MTRVRTIVVIVAGLLLVTALGGCVERLRAGLEAAHDVAAGQADAAAELGLEIACHSPSDALLRWCQSSGDICRAINYGCPTVRALVAAIRDAMAPPPTPPPVADDAPPAVPAPP